MDRSIKCIDCGKKIKVEKEVFGRGKEIYCNECHKIKFDYLI